MNEFPDNFSKTLTKYRETKGNKACNVEGMTFTNTIKQNLTLNLEPKLLNFENCSKQWQHRKLTLNGKVTVKSYALPNIIFPLTILSYPSDSA